MIKIIFFFCSLSIFSKEINLEIISKSIDEYKIEKIQSEYIQIPLDQFKTLPLKNNNDIYYKLMVTQKNQNFIFKTISFVEFNGKEKILGLTQIHATKNSTVEIVREGNGKFSLFIRPVD